jgi:hypothetical protein
MARFCHLLAAILLTVTPAAFTQEPPPPNPGFTLHVYANRLQVATLVLDAHQNNMPNLSEGRMLISLDGGPRFHPSFLRPEGEDPISLAIVLDAGIYQYSLLNSVAAALPQFVATTLHAQDHLSLFAVDCSLVRTLDNAPVSLVDVRSALRNLLSSQSLHAARGRHCSSPPGVWASIAFAAHSLDGAPGRHVLLVVSPGDDDTGRISLPQVTDALVRFGASFFAMRDGWDAMHPGSAPSSPGRGRLMLDAGSASIPDPMAFLATKNGGLVLDTSAKQVGKTLDRLVRLLRTRYIVEFPAPDSGELGMHGIDITVPRSYKVLPASATWKPLDPSLSADPHRIAGAPSPAVLGKERPRDSSR